jgi:murein DD-endopeptidase MepM/ murein hydrolase activator NlpD
LSIAIGREMLREPLLNSDEYVVRNDHNSYKDIYSCEKLLTLSEIYFSFRLGIIIHPEVAKKKTRKTDIDPEYLKKQDSLLRLEVKKEEMFDISSRSQRKLPIEGMLFFTPLKGVISQGYDPVIHPYVDIAAPEGSVVKATLDGTVIFAGWSDEAGHTIQIQHEGDIVSIYKHNDKLLKKAGDKVTAGAPIALVGNTGELTTGDHLHFELWHKGQTVDPTLYVKF